MVKIRKPPSKWAALRLVVGLFAVIGIAGGAFLAFGTDADANTPAGRGTLINCDRRRPTGDSNTPRWSCTVTYSFAGQSYRGSTSRTTFSNPSGDTVSVFVNPDDPSSHNFGQSGEDAVALGRVIGVVSLVVAAVIAAVELVLWRRRRQLKWLVAAPAGTP